MTLFFQAIASTAAIVMAGVLALHDKSVWGWFLLVAVLIGCNTVTIEHKQKN